MDALFKGKSQDEINNVPLSVIAGIRNRAALGMSIGRESSFSSDGETDSTTDTFQG